MYGLIVVPMSIEMRSFSSPWYLPFGGASIVKVYVRLREIGQWLINYVPLCGIDRLDRSGDRFDGQCCIEFEAVL